MWISIVVLADGSSGILIASWCQDRFGYRRTLQAALIWITGAIFCVVFSPNVYILFLGYVSLRIRNEPKGVF
jgi:SP family general alpha glucoside:H+ symporter-like MFS transporter